VKRYAVTVAWIYAVYVILNLARFGYPRNRSQASGPLGLSS